MSKPYWEMTTTELRQATEEYDKEFVAETAKPLTDAMRLRWERAKAKGGSQGVSSSPIANQQTVGNIGLFYVCYRLSRLGWNVMPTARNAKGIDIVIYSQDKPPRTQTIQVKTLSKGSPVPLSNNLDHLFANYVVICRHVIRDEPECFVLTVDEIRQLVHKGEKNGKISYWLQPRDYAAKKFLEKWDRIGSGLSE
jgi:hypothetical protein